MARQGLLNCENLKLGLTKWGLIMFNVAFWCIGVVSMAIGIWLYVTKNEYATLTDGKYLLGSVFLVAVGFGVIIVGFLGIVAVIWESNIVASFFGFLIFLAFGIYMTVGIWSLVKLYHVEDTTTTDLQRTITAYDTNPAYAESWNALQSNLLCCGVNSYTQWSTVRSPPATYPSSCCSEQVNCYSDSTASRTVYTEGCVSTLVEYEKQQLNVMGPIGLAFGCFQIIGLVVSILFCISVRNNKVSNYT